MLSEAEFKSNGLINLVEKNLRQHNIQAASGILLDAFIQVYSENKEKSRVERFGEHTVWLEVVQV
jgi:hypothetical protein